MRIPQSCCSMWWICEAHLDFKYEALLSAALSKHLHPCLLQLGCQAEGLQGRVACRAPWTQFGTLHHLHPRVTCQCML